MLPLLLLILVKVYTYPSIAEILILCYGAPHSPIASAKKPRSAERKNHGLE